MTWKAEIVGLGRTVNDGTTTEETVEVAKCFVGVQGIFPA